MSAESSTLDASLVYHAPPQRGLPMVSVLVAFAFAGGIFVALAVFQVQPIEPVIQEKARMLAVVEKPPRSVKQPPPPKEKVPVKDTLRVPVKPDLKIPPPILEINRNTFKFVPELSSKPLGDFRDGFPVQGSGILGDEVWDLRQVDNPPRALFVPRATYPVSLRKSGVSGRVVVECVIDSEGNAIDLSIHESTHRAFNNAALNATGRARFQPATKGGQAVAVRAQIPFRFEAPAK